MQHLDQKELQSQQSMDKLDKRRKMSSRPSKLAFLSQQTVQLETRREELQIAPVITKAEIESMISVAMANANEHIFIEFRNTDAEKLNMETKMRKIMQDFVGPVIEQTSTHKKQLVHNVHALNDFEDRIAAIEVAVFNSNKRHDKFDDIYNKLS